MDSFICVRKNGRAEMPKYITEDDENPIIFQFLNDSISLLEEAYCPEVFGIMLESLLVNAVITNSQKDSLDKLILIKNITKYLYDDDMISFFQLSNMWSDKVKMYIKFNCYPYLDEKDKAELVRVL